MASSKFSLLLYHLPGENLPTVPPQISITREGLPTDDFFS